MELSRFFYKKIKLLNWIFLGLVLFSSSSAAFRDAFQDDIYAAQSGTGDKAMDMLHGGFATARVSLTIWRGGS